MKRIYAFVMSFIVSLFMVNYSSAIDKPDLIVTSLTVTSFTANSIQYDYTIKNVGTVSANLDGPTGENHDNVNIQAFLSSDTVFNNSGDIEAGGTILGVSPLGELAPGESFSGSFGASATVDTSVTPYLTLMVDWGGVVDESDETNNTASALISSEDSKPDLIATSLTVTSFTANSIQYDYTIKNVGTVSANLDGPTGENHDNVNIQAFLSSDTVFNNSGDIEAGGTILGVSPLGELAPGESFSGSFGASATVDTSVTPYLTLMVDWGGVVDESDETNNTIAITIEECPINDTDSDGVPDKWDQCPDTPYDSIVYSSGCPATKGDFNNDNQLGLDDVIGILQTLTGIRE